MAEQVQYQLERMIPELEALEKHNIFSHTEVQSIVKNRSKFEHALHRRIKQKLDFLRAIEYETNLEKLRKKRIARMGLEREIIGTSVQYAGVRRILSLYQRATIRFKGDLSLWLQYIEFAKSSHSNKVLSSIFVQAIQYHPNNASLWIMAASFEYEQNSNMAAARILLQRALRLMPENQHLWHEYFRLELLYIEKIKLRRRVLGINQQKNAEDIEAMNVDEKEEEDDNTIQLPAVTGEDVEKWKEDEGQKKKIKLSEAEAAALEEANNPILQGLLSKIVYDNAIQAIADDIEFRKKFVEIYQEFTDTEKHIDYIYETIRRDMNTSPVARAFLAKRYLFEYKNLQMMTMTDPAFIPAFRLCVQEFDTALKEVPLTEMWELYIQFLLDWHTVATEENLKLYLVKLLQKLFKTCRKEDKLSMKLYELWSSFLMKENEEEKADNIASVGLEHFPQSVPLWLNRIAITKEEQRQLYETALENNPESLLLWTSYKDWILNNDSHLLTEEMDQLLSHACERVTLLLPSVTSSERNEIKDMIQTAYTEWAAQTRGIEEARQVYKKIMKNSYPTYAFYMKCIEVENKYGDKTGQENVEYLYDRITSLQENKDASYISYLAYLYSQKKFQKATQVYNRACKEVSDKETFDIKVQKLRESKQRNL
ncbi:U3 small nucleolar RNA-associated protein 6-domain-containing protein [Cokeromyces recurvatus]|uniref:U3 small nucleolar RNA-associated protein 6-domain-containing protein n=1 Tax=Cokeromyces recurvatus TaxID=90255 RepID=UPI00221F2BC6|nr:U3 small nucleolar RNA-associated protein 6-domain-containing protein [Cokeromyces recurvatus]KAI7899389.1 U3 small nucleolar RNA-associated protein 6-domain-containing protein [Cokeromyces recurvatus]